MELRLDGRTPPDAAPLDGVANFRDFGGYDTPYGAVRRGWLFRSGHLAYASPADLARMSGLGVRLVADLRRSGERVLDPSPWGGDRAPRVIASDLGDPEDLPVHMRALRTRPLASPEGARAYMLEAYGRLPFEPRHLEVFAATFRALAAGEGPVLVHCAAGKDRTGLLVALIHTALGVSEADLRADYDATNHPDALAAILEQTARRYAARLGREVSEAELRPLIGVEPAYLDRAFAVIEDRAGSLDAYLRDHVGLDEAMTEALRSHLLAPETAAA